MKNVKEFINELREAGIVAIATEKDKTITIDLSMSDKKELHISGDDYELDWVIFKIGDNFTIEIPNYEYCEVDAGNNCKITVLGIGASVRADNNCKIQTGNESYIYCDDDNVIECGEEAKIECEANNKIIAVTGRINIKGECDNEVYIDELNEYDGQYYIELNSGSKINIGNIEIPIS